MKCGCAGGFVPDQRVCQIVDALPSKALTAAPFSPTVSWLSTECRLKPAWGSVSHSCGITVTCNESNAQWPLPSQTSSVTVYSSGVQAKTTRPGSSELEAEGAAHAGKVQVKLSGGGPSGSVPEPASSATAGECVLAPAGESIDDAGAELAASTVTIREALPQESVWSQTSNVTDSLRGAGEHDSAGIFAAALDGCAHGGKVQRT